MVDTNTSSESASYERDTLDKYKASDSSEGRENKRQIRHKKSFIQE